MQVIKVILLVSDSDFSKFLFSMHILIILGYSSARSVCGHYSCSLVEASSFKSAYTFAHEIGHSLGKVRIAAV